MFNPYTLTSILSLRTERPGLSFSWNLELWDSLEFCAGTHWHGMDRPLASSLQLGAFLFPPPATSCIARGMWAPQPARPSSIHPHLGPPLGAVWLCTGVLVWRGGEIPTHVASGPVRGGIPGYQTPKVRSK